MYTLISANGQPMCLTHPIVVVLSPTPTKVMSLSLKMVYRKSIAALIAADIVIVIFKIIGPIPNHQ